MHRSAPHCEPSSVTAAGASHLSANRHRMAAFLAGHELDMLHKLGDRHVPAAISKPASKQWHTHIATLSRIPPATLQLTSSACRLLPVHMRQHRHAPLPILATCRHNDEPAMPIEHCCCCHGLALLLQQIHTQCSAPTPTHENSPTPRCTPTTPTAAFCAAQRPAAYWYRQATYHAHRRCTQGMPCHLHCMRVTQHAHRHSQQPTRYQEAHSERCTHRSCVSNATHAHWNAALLASTASTHSITEHQQASKDWPTAHGLHTPHRLTLHTSTHTHHGAVAAARCHPGPFA